MRHETPEWPPEAEKISENYGAELVAGSFLEASSVMGCIGRLPGQGLLDRHPPWQGVS